MKLRNLTYKITFKKSKTIFETIIAIAIVTAMLIILTNMAVMVTKAYTTVSTFVGQNYDMSVAIEDRDSAIKFYEKLPMLENYKYSHFRTTEISLDINEESMYSFCLVGAEGDYLDLFEYPLLIGRMPENNNEVIISNACLEQLNKTIGVGDEITTFSKSFMEDEIREDYAFKVVGIFEGSSADIYSIEAYTTVETIENLFDDLSYSVCVGTEADTAKELEESWNRETEMLMSVVSIDSVKDVVYNDNRHTLLSNKVSIGGGLSVVFHSVAVFIAVASMFMIYNIILSSVHKRINDYGLLRSLGCSLTDIKRNYMNIIFGTVFLGGGLGCILGFIMNHTIGKFLVGKMIGSFRSGALSELIFHDYPTAYVEAVLLVAIAVVLANIIIWHKSIGLTIVNQIKYGEETDSVIKSKGQPKKTKDFIELLGNRNLRRNKISTRCIFLNFFFVGLILSFIIIFFINLDFNDFNTFKKAEFCDYEVECNWINVEEEIILNEDELNTFKAALEDSEVYGILQLRWSYNSCNEDTLSSIEKEFLLSKGVETYIELSDEDKAEFNRQIGVKVYIADDEIIKELTGNNKKYNYDAPLVFITGEVKEELISIYDRNNLKYSIPLNGTIEENYLRDYSFDCKYDLIMNYQAAKEYLNIDKQYTGFLVKTNESEESFKEIINYVSQLLEKDITYNASYKGEAETLEQGKCIMLIAFYIVSCFFVMVISNIICTMRVTLTKRKKEFGILIVLGMFKRDVIKLLSFESKKICVSASLLSVPIGTMISVYFIIAVGHSINIGKSIIGMILSFLICFVATVITSYLVGDSLLSKTKLITNMEEE